MTTYQAESFYRGRIATTITDTQTTPITIRVNALPTLANALLTISPNTENEEIVEYNNVDAVNMTIDIIKRGILPTSILLSTSGVDYNNPLFYRSHTKNDIVRGDVNHIHINQGIGNTVLATSSGVGISKLSVAATDPGDPIVVGTNDPRVADSSIINKGVLKLSVAPVSPTNPIAVGDNDTRLVPVDASTSTKGLTKLSVSPVSAINPIAVGDNDTRLSLASTTVSGRVEIATTAEINAGTTTGGTGAVLVVSPNELKTKTDSVAAVAAAALANDVRLNTTLSATISPSGTAVSSSFLMPRWGGVSLYVSSSSGQVASAFVEISPDGSTWTDSGYGQGVSNGGAGPITSTRIYVPIKGGEYVRIKVSGIAGVNTAFGELFY